MQKITEVFYDPERNCGYAHTGDGVEFIIDMVDAPLVSSRGWHMSKRGYIAGKEHRRERPLHKLILSVDAGFDIDHINRDKTDNRRANLRVCSHHENCLNQSLRNTNTSGFMGVSFMKNAGKYEGYLHHNGVKKHLGLFTSPIEAALARDAAAKSVFGEYCHLNFPAREVTL